MFRVLASRVWSVDLARVQIRLGTVEGGLQFLEVFRGFYVIMSFVSLGASSRSQHFANFSLLSRFDLTRQSGPKIVISETED